MVDYSSVQYTLTKSEKRCKRNLRNTCISEGSIKKYGLCRRVSKVSTAKSIE